MITMRRLTLLIAAAALLAGVLPATAADFALDRAHSFVQFQVRHLAISKVRGEFNDFTASFSYEPGKPETWRAEATIQVASIDTENEDRDNHLRSEDFFHAEKYPTITFVSTGVEMEDETRGKLMGDLTIRGVTLPVVLDLEVRGMVKDPWGNTKAGFAAEGKIDRKDFGLTWHKVLETGGLVVGDEVEIIMEIQGTMQ
jgi:polyisoprenoid-binding protein YceI